ncbi:MAG: hypothetical protein E4H27_03125 [Anaerolineales bacterium]|nr:MAG: hypothetical protein E4H27_03125 [Anaerolineales bacterium]
MRFNKGLKVLLGALILTGTLGGIVVGVTLGSQAVPLEIAPPVSSDPPQREGFADIQSPTISFIDSPSATCYNPVAGTGACYISWNYLYVTAASSQYVISMTVSIDNHIRAYHSGFFQTTMYIPYDMTAPGFLVTCGTKGSGGNPKLGNAYSYTIRARETSGLSAANYGSVTCPADTIKLYLPMIQRRRH